jgi:hypothetical protein
MSRSRSQSMQKQSRGPTPGPGRGVKAKLESIRSDLPLWPVSWEILWRTQPDFTALVDPKRSTRETRDGGRGVNRVSQ